MTNPLNRICPPVIGLVCELLHAYYSYRSAQSGYDDNHHSTVLLEYRCVGLGPWDEASLSENALRKERWNYACRQVPGSGSGNRKVTGKCISYMQSSPPSRQKRGIQMPRSIGNNTSLLLTTSMPAVLLPKRLVGGERLNTLLGWELLGYSVSPLALDDTITTHLTAILHNDAGQHLFDGLVAEIRQLSGDASTERYQVPLHPWL